MKFLKFLLSVAVITTATVATSIAPLAKPAVVKKAPVSNRPVFTEVIRPPSYDGFRWQNEHGFAVGVYRVMDHGVKRDLLVFIGNITPNTTDVIEFFQKQYPDIDEIVLNSPGGSAFESVKLGSFFSRTGLKVTVPPKGICLSACAFAFLGGTDYQINGILGFHAAWLSVNKPFYTINDLNSAHYSGQYFGWMMTNWIENNGFNTNLWGLIITQTDKNHFLVMTHENELKQWMVRKTDPATDTVGDYLGRPAKISKLLKKKPDVMNGKMAIQWMRTHPSSRGRKIIGILPMWPRPDVPALKRHNNAH